MDALSTQKLKPPVTAASELSITRRSWVDPILPRCGMSGSNWTAVPLVPGLSKPHPLSPNVAPPSGKNRLTPAGLRASRALARIRALRLLINPIGHAATRAAVNELASFDLVQCERGARSDQSE